MGVSPDPVPPELTTLPKPPQCLERRASGEFYSPTELEGAVNCYRDDADNVRERFVKLRNAVRSRERIAERARQAGN